MTASLPSMLNMGIILILVLAPFLVGAAPYKTAVETVKKANGNSDDLLHSVLEYLRELSKLKQLHNSQATSQNELTQSLGMKDENVVAEATSEKRTGKGVTEPSVQQRWNERQFPTNAGVPDYKKRQQGMAETYEQIKRELVQETKTLAEQVQSLLTTLKKFVQ